MKKLLLTIISLYGNIHDESKKYINMKNNTVKKITGHFTGNNISASAYRIPLDRKRQHAKGES